MTCWWLRLPSTGYFYREWGPYGSDWDIDMTTTGGNWHVLFDEEHAFNLGLAQDDKSGNAVALVGTPVANQEVTSQVRLASFGRRAAERVVWLAGALRGSAEPVLRDGAQHRADPDPQDREWHHHRAGLGQLRARAATGV
jgi:hypothetical protein